MSFAGEILQGVFMGIALYVLLMAELFGNIIGCVWVGLLIVILWFIMVAVKSYKTGLVYLIL